MAQSQTTVRKDRPTEAQTSNQTNADSDQTCSECGHQLVADGTETYCPGCGLVEMEYNIDHGPEWSAFTEREKEERPRTGAPTTISRHDRGMSTEIGNYTDGQGNSLSGAKRRQLNRLRTHHSRARFSSKKERNLAHTNGEIRRLTSALDLSKNVRDRACYLFKQAHDADLASGRTLEALAAGAVYAVCREHGNPTTPHRVADVARVSRSKVLHCYGVLIRGLDDLAPGVFTPNDHIPRLATALNLSDATEARAHELACAAEDANLCSGASPSGFAGACIYAAVRERDLRTTQEAVAEAADVTATTVRSHWQTLTEESLTDAL